MTPEEALNNILELVGGSDEVEDAHSLQILLQSIKTLAQQALAAPELTHRSSKDQCVLRHQKRLSCASCLLPRAISIRTSARVRLQLAFRFGNQSAAPPPRSPSSLRASLRTCASGPRINLRSFLTKRSVEVSSARLCPVGVGGRECCAPACMAMERSNAPSEELPAERSQPSYPSGD